MKRYLSATLGLVCIALAISLVAMKRGDDARHGNDVSVSSGLSNQLTSAQSELTIRQERILTLSNSLDESQSASSAFSNHLAEAESNIALDREQITNLTRQVGQVESENQTLARRVMNLTNQVASLTVRIASTEARLDQTNRDWAKNYARLEDRLRRDVAERVIVERKFNNVSELQAQAQKLKGNPSWPISAESIYSGLGVEVESNGTFHVLSPD